VQASIVEKLSSTVPALRRQLNPPPHRSKKVESHQVQQRIYLILADIDQFQTMQRIFLVPSNWEQLFPHCVANSIHRRIVQKKSNRSKSGSEPALFCANLPKRRH
jgi:hypothetical protein